MPARRSPPESVLVGSDLSAASDRVVRAAARVAVTGHADLHVISAFAPPGVDLDGRPSEPSDPVLAEVSRALPAQLRRILPEGFQTASQEVRFGRASSVILERAREVDAGLIVLGPHRGTDVHAQFLGTTADAVLRGSIVPCLTVRGVVNIPLRRIIVAVDLADTSQATITSAFRYGQWLGQKGASDSGGTEVRMIHFAEHPAKPEADVRERLDRAIAEAVDADDSAERLKLTGAILRDDDPASAILDETDRFGADLLVVGTRGKRKRQGANLGSISSAIARRASCPVLLIPPS